MHFLAAFPTNSISLPHIYPSLASGFNIHCCHFCLLTLMSFPLVRLVFLKSVPIPLMSCRTCYRSLPMSSYTSSDLLTGMPTSSNRSLLPPPSFSFVLLFTFFLLVLSLLHCFVPGLELFLVLVVVQWINLETCL